MRIALFQRPIVILLLIIAVVAALFSPWLAIAAVLACVTIFYLSRNLGFGLIILVFFFPYLGLVVDFSSFTFLQDVPYLKDINAPFIDLFGLVFFVAWVLHLFLSSRGRRPWRSLGDCFPPRSSLAVAMTLRGLHFKSYFLFWLSGLVSLWKVPTIYFYSSLKYFARPFTFCYLVFFAPVVNILTSGDGLKGGKEEERWNLLQRVLWVFFATGLISAMDGFLGFVFGTGGEFPRAMPFGFWGVNPLGPNHNLLAETLIATAPVGLLLIGIKDYGLKIKQWIWWGMLFQWLIALLTFARTAWIAVAIQAIIYIALVHRKRLREFLKGAAPAIVLLAAMSLLLVSTIFSETVRGSTLSRLDQVRIAEFYFERSPLIGQGIGTFIPTLWQTKAFLLEYGEPLDVHGVLFKLMFEQGMLGLIGFTIFAGSILWVIVKGIKREKGEKGVLIAALLIAAGSLTYQLLNTTYYTSKLWVPLAIAVSIAHIYAGKNKKEDLGMA